MIIKVSQRLLVSLVLIQYLTDNITFSIKSRDSSPCAMIAFAPGDIAEVVLHPHGEMPAQPQLHCRRAVLDILHTGPAPVVYVSFL